MTLGIPPLPAGRTGRRRYQLLAEEMRDALDNMQAAIGESFVDGGSKGPPPKLRAWGVWVNRARRDQAGEPQGQHGVLGTSAGLELMASTREFRDDITDEDRRKLIVGSWLYLYDKLAPVRAADPPAPADAQDGGDDSPGDAREVGALEASAPPDPRGTLLVRQAQVLRALSALEHHLTAVLHGSEEAVPLRGNRRLAAEVLQELKKCRHPDIPVSRYPALRDVSQGSDVVAGYSYLSTHSGSPDDPEALPETPIEWAYLLGCVLVALSRSYLAYFLPAEEFAEYITSADVERLARWAQKAVSSENPDELRVGLFAGWAILQLELLVESTTDRTLGDLHTGGTGGIVDSGAHQIDVWLPPKERRRLARALREGSESVITNASLQPDLHHPYSFHITSPDSEHERDPYKQDHLVVPTVPIALWLKARLDRRALFDPRFEQLARRVAKCFEDPSNARVAPGQSSTYNGTVNMNYFHEAAAEVHDLAQRTASQSFFWRLLAVVHRPRPLFDRVSSSPKTALVAAVVLGLIASPLAGWGWGLVGIVPGGNSENGKTPARLAPAVITVAAPASAVTRRPGGVIAILPSGTATVRVVGPSAAPPRHGGGALDARR